MRRHVKHLLTAYVHDELPPHLVSRVSQHLESCDSCYIAMVAERELSRTLETQMPAFGQPQPQQLARLLPGILAEVTPSPPRRSPYRLSGVGLALVFTLLIALFAPVMLSPRVVAEYAPDQPAPHMIAATATLSTTDAPVYLVASPTAVARRLAAATEPAEIDPPPAPVAQATPNAVY